jgi:hypothetical protein
MSLVFIASVFVGFAPTYYLRGSSSAPPLTPVVHVHGAVFTVWILLFLTQTALVASGRRDLHRRLGLIGAGWAALVCVFGASVTLDAMRRRSFATIYEASEFLALSAGAIFVFSVLVAAGLYFRRSLDTHKRLMLLATIVLLEAAIARWPLAILSAGPVAFFVLTDVFILPGVLYDLLALRRVHLAYVWGGLLIIVSQPAQLWLADTGAWHSLTRFVLP